MWELPRSGLEPVSTALAGGLLLLLFFTTEPPGKPLEDPAFLIESPSLFRRAVTALFFPCLPEVLSGSFLSF